MKLTDLEKSLVEGMESFEIIDCHEHLGPEKQRLEGQVDVFTLFSHYTRGDLTVAGMSDAEYESLFDRAVPLEQRWRTFKPYLENIRWASYARAALVAAKKFYGFDDINDQTYRPLSEAMQKANTAGIYQRVLREACGIRTALTQCGSTELGTDLLTPVMPLVYGVETGQDLAHPPFEPQAGTRSLDEYLDAVRRYVLRVKSQGAVGLKMMSNPYQAPSRGDAASAERTPISSPTGWTCPRCRPGQSRAATAQVRDQMGGRQRGATGEPTAIQAGLAADQAAIQSLVASRKDGPLSAVDRSAEGQSARRTAPAGATDRGGSVDRP